MAGCFRNSSQNNLYLSISLKRKPLTRNTITRKKNANTKIHKQKTPPNSKTEKDDMQSSLSPNQHVLKARAFWWSFTARFHFSKLDLKNPTKQTNKQKKTKNKRDTPSQPPQPQKKQETRVQ